MTKPVGIHIDCMDPVWNPQAKGNVVGGALRSILCGALI